MKLIKGKESFVLNFKGKDLLGHHNSEPFLSVGKGSATYEMDRGAFVIDEKLEYKNSLQIDSIESTENKHKISFISENKKFGLSVIFSEENNRVVMEFDKPIGDINRVWVKLNADKEEHIYGCGELFSHFDLRGQNVKVWVAEHQNLKRNEKKFTEKRATEYMDFEDYETYYVQPTFVSSQKYFVHVETNAYTEFDFRNDSSHGILVRDIPKKIIIGKNDSFDDLIGNVTSLLGRQPELPAWLFNGVLLGLQGGTDVILEKVDKALDKGVKISGLWCQDWQGRRDTGFGQQLMWNWKYDNDLYPNIEKTILELKERGIEFTGYINTFLAVEKEMYKEASKEGYLVKNKKGEDYLVTITDFPASMIDLTNPKACRWIKDIIIKNMIGIGMAGWMADYGEYLPVDAVLHSEEDAKLVHNTWPAIWARINREAIQEAGKEGEVFFFTRAGHTETVKYSTLMWAGDQHVDWSEDDGIGSVIPATLSLAMCGFGLSHSDIGGYTTLYDLKRTRELFMRWAEMGAFSSIMRSHEGNRPKVNIQFDCDDETLELFARMTQIYTKISPYIKDLVTENAKEGIPVMRPLFMYYEEEKAFETKFEYLLGRDLLVAPVIKDKREDWTVYLPQDDWVHLWSQKEYKGGNHTVNAKMGYTPVFYRRNSKYKKLFEEVRTEFP